LAERLLFIKMPFGPYNNGFGGFQPGPSPPDRTDGSVAAPESELSTLYRKFEQFQEYDLEKNKFINVRLALPPVTPSLTCPGTSDPR
jgi:hypothetical protein